MNQTPKDDSLRRILLGIAGALFLAGLGFALYAALYRPTYVLLVPLDAAERTWLAKAIEPFAKRSRVNLVLTPYATDEELVRLLDEAKRAKKSNLLLAATPTAALGLLADSSLVVPLTRGREEPALAPLLESVEPSFLAPGTIDGRPMFVPTSMRTRALYYSKARVADAVAHWEEHRSAIEARFRAANGHGLPANYRLEANPADWTSDDLTVLAATWASTEYEGRTAPRLAHVNAPDAALAMDLAALTYEHGGGNGELVTLDGVGLRDALLRESYWFDQELYVPAMRDSGFDEEALLAAIGHGEVFAALLDARAAFRLAGLTADGAALVPDRADVGITTLPRGVSLDQDRGYPARSGDPWSARDAVWWGVPAHSPAPKLAVDLVEFLVRPDVQVQAMIALGWMPSRRDLASDMSSTARDPARYELAGPLNRQLTRFGKPLPTAPAWMGSQAALAGAWREACARDRLDTPLAIATVLERFGRAGRR